MYKHDQVSRSTHPIVRKTRRYKDMPQSVTSYEEYIQLVELARQGDFASVRKLHWVDAEQPEFKIQLSRDELGRLDPELLAAIDEAAA